MASVWALPVLFLPKKDGSFRFCIDYCRRSEVTIENKFLLFCIYNCVGFLEAAKIISTLDVSSGYWQIPVKKEDCRKTAFLCHEGLYCYKQMRFGLTATPATFWKALLVNLSGFKLREHFIYLFHVIVISNLVKEHYRQVAKIMRILEGVYVALKLLKCDFSCIGVTYFGRAVKPRMLELMTL